jgi:hypothetical protein
MVSSAPPERLTYLLGQYALLSRARQMLYTGCVVAVSIKSFLGEYLRREKVLVKSSMVARD